MPASDNPDQVLFPAFETRRIALAQGEVFVRIAGPEDGAPLLLLHGFPQTGAMWAEVAERLRTAPGGAGRRIVVPDLPGYGLSALPEGGSSPERMSKRRLASDMVALMKALGHETFDLAGHDRGARVSYRLALDAPAAVRRLAVLDIVPTLDYWERCADRAFNVAIYHWTFLAQPRPIPETLIAAAPVEYLERLMASWTQAKSLAGFPEAALAAYRANAAPEILTAMCDDYRAGATLDAEYDAADRAAGRKIAAPVLALWGAAGIAKKASAPIEIWRRWADEVSGAPIPCGHFMPEESPAETAAALDGFFAV